MNKDINHNEVIKLYEKHHNMSKVAKEMGINVYKIRNILLNNDIHKYSLSEISNRKKDK